MPLVNIAATAAPTLTSSLADGATTFANRMARQNVNENQQAAAALNREKTLGEAAWNNAMAENRSTIRGNMHQPGTMIEGNMAVDRPLTQQQNWDNEDAMRRMALKEPEENPWTRDKYGRTYSQSTGRTMDGGQERIGEIEQMGDANIQADTFKSNAAGQKSIADSLGGISAADQSKLNFSQEKDLRGEYTKNTSEFAKINDAWPKVLSSFNQKSAAGDHAGIFAYMKMLDPSSTVREGEFATVANTGSIPNRVWSAYNKAKKGTLMTDEMREDFLKAAGNVYNDAYDVYDKRGVEATSLAERYGLNAENVVYNRAMHDRYVSKDEQEFNALVEGGMTEDEAYTAMGGM